MTAFAELAAEPAPSLDRLALALAGEFREVDEAQALGRLDALGEEVAAAVAAGDGSAAAQARACAEVLGGAHGFEGDREAYDHPDNSMLDVVLERRRGLPILLSVVYLEAARRAEVPLAGVGLPGHFVVAHFGAGTPVLLDPFDRGFLFDGDVDVDDDDLEPWGPFDIALRMLNNLVGAFWRRGDLSDAVHAAGMRLALPVDEAQREALEAELRELRNRLR